MIRECTMTRLQLRSLLDSKEREARQLEDIEEAMETGA